MTNFIIELARKKGDMSDAAVRNRAGLFGGLFGIFSNLFLCVIKITVGALTHSISIVADGLNNFSDMGSSVIALLGFKLASKPADSDHPYGHGRMEYMSAFIVSSLIMLVGFELLKDSALALYNGASMPTYSLWAIIVLVISVIIKFIMFLFNRHLAKQINSAVLEAAAKDSVNDCIATLVILISVIVSRIITLNFNLDAVLGIGVALFILYSGFVSAKETLNVILGNAPDKALIEEIKQTVMQFDMFLGIHDLIVHNYGPNRLFASVHVEVSEDIGIVAAHTQIDMCEKLIKEKLGVDIVIHIDPLATNDGYVDSVKLNISKALRDINKGLSLHDFRMSQEENGIINLVFDVAVPANLDMSADELCKKICAAAKQIDERFECILTFDNNYIG